MWKLFTAEKIINQKETSALKFWKIVDKMYSKNRLSSKEANNVKLRWNSKMDSGGVVVIWHEICNAYINFMANGYIKMRNLIFLRR